MPLSSRLRKFTLSVHLVVSLGWIRTVIAYLVLGTAAASNPAPETVRGAWSAMLADIAQDAEPARLDELGGELVHPSLGLLLLLVIHVLNVYNPRGMTRYGHRKTQKRRTAPTH